METGLVVSLAVIVLLAVFAPKNSPRVFEGAERYAGSRNKTAIKVLSEALCGSQRKGAS